MRASSYETCWLDSPNCRATIYCAVMNTTERLQSREHARASELLSWYVNGTLPSPDYEAVKKHLCVCAQCSQEQVRLMRLQQVMRDDAPVPLKAQSATPFDALLERVDHREREIASGKQGRGRFWPEFKLQIESIPAAVKWACALQSGALVLLCIALLQSNNQDNTDPLYHTVSDPNPGVPASTIQFRVMFAETAAETEIRELLLSLSAQIVAGPSPHGVYTLALTGESADTSASAQTLEQLRARDVVGWAEPLL